MTTKEELDKVFNKELFLIKNDLYYQQVNLMRGGENTLLRVDISYQPYDVLSGDTYSLRKTKDGRLVGFIADAMGKGISAAMSGMAITRFLNYFFEELEEESAFRFDAWLTKMLRYLRSNLQDEEIMSIVLVCFDMQNAFVEYASCGMPAFFVCTQDNAIVTLKSNNPPICNWTEDLQIATLHSATVKKMLCFSDGLSESSTSDGKPYGLILKEDFANATCAKDFRDIVKARLGKAEDDLTYVYVDKVQKQPSFKTLVISSTYEAMNEALQDISGYLKGFDISPKCTSELILTFSELLLNALEHGSFGVDKARKNYLIENDLFDEEMERLEALHCEKKIRIEYGILPSGERSLFEAIIEDEGSGFDTKVLKELVINPHNVNGRGFMIIKKLLDHFYFNEKGNAITIQKFVS